MSLTAWLLLQISQVIKIGWLFVFGGILGAIWQRQFAWRAFFLSLIIQVTLISYWGHLLLDESIEVPTNQQLLFWVLCFASSVLSGFVLGKFASCLGFWESYALTIISLILFGLQGLVALGFVVEPCDGFAISHSALRCFCAHGGGSLLFII